eukprot:TRINITY_DN6047_c0_g1_i1.p1 TRINITY_DN6047_c0_g1~~TRINITY_DN6047_c0_g1_i1.p1  ORF type:complete len:423 (+),score=-1.12 TRINITY_DN6047_c0_g1_i1:158-1270(+)
MSGRGGDARRPAVDKAADFANYFCTYAFLYHQKDMLSDRVRMTAYHDAVFKNRAHFLGKTVLDVGTGSGILAIWAAQAGARRVYAVEATDMATHATALAKANGVDHIVTVLQASAEEIDLPEKVDVLISEWMGYFLVRESMLDSVIHARDKWLKPGGAMFPSHARMWVAPVQSALWDARQGELRHSLSDWAAFVRDTAGEYGVDMGALTDAYRREQNKYFVQTGCWESLYPSQVVGRPVMIREMDCHTVTVQDVETVQADFRTAVFDGTQQVNALAGWFDVSFKGSKSDPAAVEVQLTTAPSVDEGTHWGQQVFLLSPALPTPAGSSVAGSICIERSQRNHRLMDVRLSVKAEGGEGAQGEERSGEFFIE